MKLPPSILLAAWIIPTLLQATTPQVRFALTVHSETAGGGSNGIPITPNFTNPSTSKSVYLQWREALLKFARMCETEQLAWQMQSDYNFLEGVRRFETATGSNYDAGILTGDTTDDTVTAYTATGSNHTTATGVNVMKYLHDTMHVNLDPHSHESNASYNYADIAWLIEVGCQTVPTAVVGGHVADPNAASYQNWPKFIATTSGLAAATHTKVGGGTYYWKPHLLMGAGGRTHKDDPHVTGLWRPQSSTNYFADTPATTSGYGSIATIGHWEQDFFETDRLLRSLEDGSLAHNDRLWTVGRVMNHRDFVQPNYLTITAPAILKTIRAWRDAGRFQVKTFEDIYNEWQAAPYNAASSLYLRPTDNVSFSLNWQEFCYRSQSYAELRLLLNHHEAMRVPVDVFLTTWQVDYLEAEAPELLGRLFSSRWVNVSYHVRPPKPYAFTASSSTSTSATSWRTYTSADVTTYETSQLNMTTGQPVSGVSGGFDKLTSLYGSAPRIVGPNWDTASRPLVFPYFYAAGARMVVQHDSNSAVVFGTSVSVSGVGSLNVRPESYDWKLIETFNPSVAPSGSIIATTLDEALNDAHSASGAAAPYFTGVKLHDNDLFATASAWATIYAKKVPNWDITIGGTPGYEGPFKWADTLTSAESNRRRSFYARTVTTTASRRPSLNIVDTRDTLSMLGEDAPRPIGLSVTEVPSGTSIGTALAEISGGGTESGLQCSYALVSGVGSEDNADFSISGTALLQAAVLDRTTKAVRHLRLRWTDLGGATGERALTVVLGTSDDDSDGFTNEEELSAGTNPANAASRLTVSSMQIAGNQVVVTWNSTAGITYHIEYSSDLTHWSVVANTSTNATGDTSSAMFTSPSTERMFFRVVVD